MCTTISVISSYKLTPTVYTYFQKKDKWVHLDFIFTSLVFKWLVQYIGHSTQTDHLNTEPFENQTSKVLIFKCLQYSNDQYFQSPTVQQMIILQPAFTYTSFQFSSCYQCYKNLLFHERFLIAILFLKCWPLTELFYLIFPSTYTHIYIIHTLSCIIFSLIFRGDFQSSIASEQASTI